jgi:hypothetical protein
MQPALATGHYCYQAGESARKALTGRTGRSLQVLAYSWRQATLARSCHDVST